jgi:O-antigen ligase
MPDNEVNTKGLDYEPVLRRPHPRSDSALQEFSDVAFNSDVECTSKTAPKEEFSVLERDNPKRFLKDEKLREASDASARLGKSETRETWIQKHGHSLSFAGLFLFTFMLYVRPYELVSALSWLQPTVFWLGTATLFVFIITQLGLENKITARPREVNLALLLLVTGLLSVPFALSPSQAWATFVDPFLKVVLMFIVIVNVVRTDFRLKALLLLAIVVSLVLSITAINDYRLGYLAEGGVRIGGMLGNLFDNPNDLALHLVTMIPLAVALFFIARNPLAKAFFVVTSLAMIGAVVASFSRGGFLGLAAAGAVLCWKIGRRHRFIVIVGAIVVLGGLLIFAPGGYGIRLISIFSQELDSLGSVGARRELLTQSLWTALRHPLFGVGMGNFIIVSNHEHVTHNAYTQVASEIGLAACVIYVLFIITPLRRLYLIERETQDKSELAKFYYLSIALEASLIGYMVSSFFASVAYLWYVYYLVGYAISLRRLLNRHSKQK